MYRNLIYASTAVAIAAHLTPALAQGETSLPLLQTPSVERIDVTAQPAPGNRLPACHLAGSVTLWVSRTLHVLDDMQQDLGTVKAGLAQFAGGAKLEGCLADSAALDLSSQFTNFVVSGDSSAAAGDRGRAAASALASQLAQDFYHLAEPEGAIVPIVEGQKISALGAVSYRFTIVLVRNVGIGDFDAVIQRETVRTKFSPRLPANDRALSRVKWSSVQQD